MIKDPPPRPAPGQASRRAREEESRINEFSRTLLAFQQEVIASAHAAAGLDGNLHGIPARIRQQAAQVLGSGPAAARPPPGLFENGAKATRVPPGGLFRDSLPLQPSAWDRLDPSTRAAARVVQEMEAAAGRAITLQDDWERQGYHFAVPRGPKIARAWVIPMSLYNTTVTLEGFALARFFLDEEWVAYLVQAEPGHEAVAIARRAFLEEHCPGLRVPPAALGDLERVLAGTTGLWERHGIPLQVAMSSPLAVHFRVLLQTLWNFAPLARDDENGKPSLVEVWQKDPETGGWYQEPGSARREPPGGERGNEGQGTPTNNHEESQG